MEKTVKIFTFDNIEATKVLWLWKPYIALGKLTVIQGDPGTGKTTLALAIASLVSKNKRMPTGRNKPIDGSVLFQSGEDSPSDTIKPRLVACKADCSKIAFMESDTGLDLQLFEEAIIGTSAKLVVIDPLQAFLTAGQDISSTKNMRPFLRELSNVAERTGAAVVIIGHMNKNDRTKGIYRGLGSIDITAAARSVLLIGKLKNNENMRFMAQIKNNLTAFGKAVSFSISKHGSVEFHGECSISEDELLSVSGEKKSKYHTAKDIIMSMLSDGDKKSNEIFDACMKAGVSASTMSYVKRELGVESVRKLDDWYWTVKADSDNMGNNSGGAATDETPVTFLEDMFPSKEKADFGSIEIFNWRS